MKSRRMSGAVSRGSSPGSGADSLLINADLDDLLINASEDVLLISAN